MMDDTLLIRILLKRCAGQISEAFYNPSRDRGSLRVLIYHNITDDRMPSEWEQMTTPKALFDGQMRYLKDLGYRTINAQAAVNCLASQADIPEKTVLVTFDDGCMDNYANALPVLERYGFKATVFLTTEFIGKSGYLGWGEIGEMAKSGICTFGCHSCSHKNLVFLNDAELAREIGDAKHILEDGLGTKIDIFAYPFGWHSSFNRNVVSAVKTGGFSAAFTGVCGANTKQTDRFMLRRIRVSWLDDLAEFEKIMHGSYDWYNIYQRIVSIWHKPRSMRI